MAVNNFIKKKKEKNKAIRKGIKKKRKKKIGKGEKDRD